MADERTGGDGLPDPAEGLIPPERGSGSARGGIDGGTDHPAELTPRPAGRIVLIDGRDRLLLLRTAELSDRSRHFWLTPGGGLEAGEDFRAAAERELWEEVGLRDVTFGPCVWDRRHVWPWGERMIASWERFFLVRVAGEVEVRPQHQDPLEVELDRGHRWWSVEELVAAKSAGEVFVPRAIPTLLPPLLRGDLPPQPIEIRPKRVG